MNIKAGFCFVLLVVGLFGCSPKKATDSELAGIEAYAKAEVTIERMRKQKEVNWDAIKAQYEIASAVVKNYDAKLQMRYDAEIREALDKCAAGQKVKVNQQIPAKGLQHITVLAIKDKLDAMGKSAPAERKVFAERIKAYFEGIRPTFVRRDKDFFGENKTLEAAADTNLERLAKAGSADYLTARRELEDVIARTYGLCVLYEIMGVEKYRDSDLAKCEVKKTEAVVFYRIIEPRIKKHRPKIDEVISNMLNGNYDTMNVKILEEALKTGLRLINLK
jgi:predicted HicB family RNase H-like nuclease